MFLFRPSSLKAKHFVQATAEDEYERIKGWWTDGCERRGKTVPPKALAEIAKRVSQSKNGGKGKAKLNFSNCDLDDDHIVTLCDALFEYPVIAKLELDNNKISDTGASAIVDLLNKQANQINTLAIEDRLDATYLGEIILSKTKMNIFDIKLAEIQHLSVSMRYANTASHIRVAYYTLQAPPPINAEIMGKVWETALGKPNHSKVILAIKQRSKTGDRSTIEYEDMERAILAEMRRKALLPAITKEQRAVIGDHTPDDEYDPEISSRRSSAMSLAGSIATARSKSFISRLPFTSKGKLRDNRSDSSQVSQLSVSVSQFSNHTTTSAPPTRSPLPESRLGVVVEGGGGVSAGSPSPQISPAMRALEEEGRESESNPPSTHRVGDRSTGTATTPPPATPPAIPAKVKSIKGGGNTGGKPTESMPPKSVLPPSMLGRADKLTALLAAVNNKAPLPSKTSESAASANAGDNSKDSDDINVTPPVTTPPSSSTNPTNKSMSPCSKAKLEDLRDHVTKPEELSDYKVGVFMCGAEAAEKGHQKREHDDDPSSKDQKEQASPTSNDNFPHDGGGASHQGSLAAGGAGDSTEKSSSKEETKAKLDSMIAKLKGKGGGNSNGAGGSERDDGTSSVSVSGSVSTATAPGASPSSAPANAAAGVGGTTGAAGAPASAPASTKSVKAVSDVWNIVAELESKRRAANPAPAPAVVEATAAVPPAVGRVPVKVPEAATGQPPAEDITASAATTPLSSKNTPTNSEGSPTQSPDAMSIAALYPQPNSPLEPTPSFILRSKTPSKSDIDPAAASVASTGDNPADDCVSVASTGVATALTADGESVGDSKATGTAQPSSAPSVRGKKKTAFASPLLDDNISVLTEPSAFPTAAAAVTVRPSPALEKSRSPRSFGLSPPLRTTTAAAGGGGVGNKSTVIDASASNESKQEDAGSVHSTIAAKSTTTASSASKYTTPRNKSAIAPASSKTPLPPASTAKDKKKKANQAASVPILPPVGEPYALSDFLVYPESYQPPAQGGAHINFAIPQFASTLLDLSHSALKECEVPNYVSGGTLKKLRVLILRGNDLTDIASLQLSCLVKLTDLDISYNNFTGEIPLKSMPPNVERLDMSHNKIDDLTGLFSCTKLHSLNASCNSVKQLAGLPPRVVALDLSYNQLSSDSSLRLLSIASNITSIGIAGNPVVRKSDDWRILLSSMLPELRFIDGKPLPGSRVRKKVTAPGVHIPPASTVSKLVVGSPSRTSHNAPSSSSSYFPSEESKGGEHPDSPVTGSKRSLLPVNTSVSLCLSMSMSVDDSHIGVSSPVRVAHMSKEEQEKADKNRYQLHTLKMKALQRARDEYDKERMDQIICRKIALTAEDTHKLVNRLAIPPKPDLRFRKIADDLRLANAAGGLQRRKRRASHGDSLGGPSFAALTVSFAAKVAAPNNLTTAEAIRRTTEAARDPAAAGRKPGVSSSVAFGAGLSIIAGNAAAVTNASYPPTHKPSSSAAPAPTSAVAILDPIAYATVNNWMNLSNQEMGRAAAVLRILFWMSEKAAIEPNYVSTFSNALDRIEFVRSVQVPDLVELALRRVANMTDTIEAASATLENMAAFSAVLEDVEKAVLTTAALQTGSRFDPVFISAQLRASIEAIMCSSLGQFVNDTILLPNQCEYNYRNAQLRARTRSHTSRHVHTRHGHGEPAHPSDDGHGHLTSVPVPELNAAQSQVPQQQQQQQAQVLHQQQHHPSEAVAADRQTRILEDISNAPVGVAPGTPASSSSSNRRIPVGAVDNTAESDSYLQQHLTFVRQPEVAHPPSYSNLNDALPSQQPAAMPPSAIAAAVAAAVRAPAPPPPLPVLKEPEAVAESLLADAEVEDRMMDIKARLGLRAVVGNCNRQQEAAAGTGSEGGGRGGGNDVVDFTEQFPEAIPVTSSRDSGSGGGGRPPQRQYELYEDDGEEEVGQQQQQEVGLNIDQQGDKVVQDERGSTQTDADTTAAAAAAAAAAEAIEMMERKLSVRQIIEVNERRSSASGSPSRFAGTSGGILTSLSKSTDAVDQQQQQTIESSTSNQQTELKPAENDAAAEAAAIDEAPAEDYEKTKLSNPFAAAVAARAAQRNSEKSRSGKSPITADGAAAVVDSSAAAATAPATAASLPLQTSATGNPSTAEKEVAATQPVASSATSVVTNEAHLDYDYPEEDFAKTAQNNPLAAQIAAAARKRLSQKSNNAGSEKSSATAGSTSQNATSSVSAPTSVKDVARLDNSSSPSEDSSKRAEPLLMTPGSGLKRPLGLVVSSSSSPAAPAAPTPTAVVNTAAAAAAVVAAVSVGSGKEEESSSSANPFAAQIAVAAARRNKNKSSSDSLADLSLAPTPLVSVPSVVPASDTAAAVAAEDEGRESAASVPLPVPPEPEKVEVDGVVLDPTFTSSTNAMAAAVAAAAARRSERLRRSSINEVNISSAKENSSTISTGGDSSTAAVSVKSSAPTAIAGAPVEMPIASPQSPEPVAAVNNTVDTTSDSVVGMTAKERIKLRMKSVPTEQVQAATVDTIGNSANPAPTITSSTDDKSRQQPAPPKSPPQTPSAARTRAADKPAPSTGSAKAGADKPAPSTGSAKAGGRSSSSAPGNYGSEKSIDRAKAESKNRDSGNAINTPSKPVSVPPSSSSSAAAAATSADDSAEKKVPVSPVRPARSTDIDYSAIAVTTPPRDTAPSDYDSRASTPIAGPDGQLIDTSNMTAKDRIRLRMAAKKQQQQTQSTEDTAP